MTGDVSSSRAAARALSARNPVSFDCIHPLDASVQRLSDAVNLEAPLVVAVRRNVLLDEVEPGRPSGEVGPDGVDLAWKSVRFRGRWVDGGASPRLEGTMQSAGSSPALVIFGIFIAMFALLGALLGGVWVVALPGLLAMVALPLLVAGLGSARVADEIDLTRRIGVAIGDAEKYAPRWRRWKDD